MPNFEDYTIVLSETPRELFDEFPQRRFVAFLKEIPEASFHAYGANHINALKALASEYEDFVKECEARGIQLPTPSKVEREFSGKLVLRMPSWMHQVIKDNADSDEVSLNNYILKHLLAATLESKKSRIPSFNDFLNEVTTIYHITGKWSETIKVKRKFKILLPTSKEEEYSISG